MEQYIPKSIVVAEINRRYEYWKEKEFNSHSIESEIRMSECQHLLLMVNSLQEEPISEKKCMFTKDNYTDEDRIVLCEDCKEKCEYSKKEEPVNEELEKAANKWDAKASFTPFYMALDDKGNPYEVKRDYTTHAESFKAGAKWHEEQMMTKAIEGTARPDDNEIWCDLKSFNFKDGDKVKVIIIKED